MEWAVSQIADEVTLRVLPQLHTQINLTNNVNVGSQPVHKTS